MNRYTYRDSVTGLIWQVTAATIIEADKKLKELYGKNPLPLVCSIEFNIDRLRKQNTMNTIQLQQQQIVDAVATCIRLGVKPPKALPLHSDNTEDQ